MSFLATPYIITGGLSLYLSYKTYNSYYNKPFEYIEIEDLNLQENEKSLEIETHTDENEKVNSDKGCKEDMVENNNVDNNDVDINGNTDLGKFDTVDDLVRPDSSNDDENLSQAKNKYIDNIIKEDININEDKLEYKKKKNMVCKLETIIEENEEEVRREMESDAGNIAGNMAKKVIDDAIVDAVDDFIADKVSEKKSELVVDKSDLESNILLNRYNNKGLRKRKKKKNKNNKRK